MLNWRIFDFGQTRANIRAAEANAQAVASAIGTTTLDIESRLPGEVVAGLARMGVTVNPLPEWDYHMGSFHMSWRDPKTGLLNASADARRAGMAGGY